MSKDVKTAGSIKQRLKDSRNQKIYKIGSIPGDVKIIDTQVYRRSKYGLQDSFGNPVEVMYDYSLENLYPGSPLQATVFVADQFHSMKRKFEELSNKGGAYGILEPERALIRADELYDSYMAELLDAFVTQYFPTMGDKMITFHDFCNHFLSFIIRSRGAKMKGGLPISRSLFFASDRVPINSSGLVIDFKTSKYNDTEHMFSEWMSDINFPLFCDAAARSGFFIDGNHPFRIIADISSKKMQRAAEFRGGSYRPGSSGLIFEDFYLRVDLYDFMHLKNKLLQSYHEFSQANRIIYRKKVCSGKVLVQEVNRELLKLENLVVPPLPNQLKKSPTDILGPDAAGAQFNSAVSYGLHDDKYDLAYFTKLYIEVRLQEIQLIKKFLTPKKKRAIVKKALKMIHEGNIEGAFAMIGKQFNSYRMIIH